MVFLCGLTLVLLAYVSSFHNRYTTLAMDSHNMSLSQNEAGQTSNFNNDTGLHGTMRANAVSEHLYIDASTQSIY